MDNNIKTVKIDKRKIDLLESRIMRLLREKAFPDMTDLEIIIALNKVLASVNIKKEMVEMVE